MPFVPYLDMTPEQRHAARNRPSEVATQLRSLRLAPSAHEETYAMFAFWVRPDGSVAPSGMIQLPLLERRDGKHYRPDPATRRNLGKPEPVVLTTAQIADIRASDASCRTIMRDYKIGYYRLKKIKEAA